MIGFFVSNVLLAAASWRLARGIGQDVFVQAAAGLLAFQLGAAGIALTLALVGALTPLPQVALALVLAGTSLAVRPAEPLPASSTPAPPQHATDRVGIALLAATLTGWVFGPAFRGTALSYDDATYHAAIPAYWLSEGHYALAPFTYQAYYPLQSELVSLWFMIPTHDLTHAGLAPVLHALLVAAAGLALARHLGAPTGPAAALFATFFVSRRILQAAHTVSAADLCGTANLVAAAMFALVVPGWTGAILFGLAAGAALGTKLTTAPGLALLGLWFAWHRRSAPAQVATAAGLGLAIGGGWYAHNAWLTGNPVFPAALGPFAGPLDPETQYLSSLRRFLDPRRPLWIFYVVRTRLNWPLPLALAGLAGLLSGVVIGVRKRRWDLLLLGAIGLLAILLLPRQPFSGTVNRPGQSLNTIVRYLMPSLALGVVTLAGTLGPHRHATAIAAALWTVTLLASLEMFGLPEVALLGGGAAIAFFVWPHRARLGSRPVAALVTLLLLANALHTPQKRWRTVQRLATISLSSMKQAELWSAIHRLPPGSVVAQVADVPVDNDHSLRAFGVRFQHRYHPVDLDGTLLRPLHERWRDEPPGWWWRWEQPQTDAFLDNLAKTDVDFLVVSRCNEFDTWPSVRDRLPETSLRRVHASDCGEIWEVGHP